MPTELTPLLRHCLETTAAQLADEFHGVFSPETVTRYVEDSYEQIGDRPTVGPNFLPVIIERFAREQLWAVAQADGSGREAAPGGAVRVRAQRRAQPDGRLPRPRPLERLGRGSLRRVASRRADRPGRASRRWRRSGSTSAPSSPSRSPTPWSAPPTSWSRWAAVTRARCIPASATRTGRSPIPPASRSEVVRRIRYELYHHVWELIETLVPSVDLLTCNDPEGARVESRRGHHRHPRQPAGARGEPRGDRRDRGRRGSTAAGTWSATARTPTRCAG